ncbi:MAG TPA: hypothetical protein VFK78_05770 [Gemmatimonadales bacterium]|nr:hypothetical protein [Gemmatimonadales bacterium]
MAPVPVARLKAELEKLKQEMDAGNLKHGEYDQRLARVIGELRDQRIDADRAAVLAAVADLLQRGIITPAVKAHIEKRLGLT